MNWDIIWFKICEVPNITYLTAILFIVQHNEVVLHTWGILLKNECETVNNIDRAPLSSSFLDLTVQTGNVH